MVGDEILSIDGTRVHTYSEMRYAIMHDGYKPVDVVVLRGGERVTLTGVTFPTAASEGILFGIVDFGIELADKTVGKVLGREDTVREGTASDLDFGDWLLQKGEVTENEYNELQTEAKELLGV